MISTTSCMWCWGTPTWFFAMRRCPNTVVQNFAKCTIPLGGVQIWSRDCSLSAERRRIKPQPLNLNRRIEDLRRILDRTLPKMIDIHLLLGEGLAAINADPTQIDQILMNLAVNARDAMPDGGRLTIETANFFLSEDYVRTHLEAHSGVHVLLTVTDTGMGMDQGNLGALSSSRSIQPKAWARGTGLGLAMVHGIVKHHEGHISCYSEPGHGTTFKIFFPALAADEKPEESVVTEMPRGGSETILLVDDEKLIRDLGSTILRDAGYKVITAPRRRRSPGHLQTSGE